LIEGKSEWEKISRKIKAGDLTPAEVDLVFISKTLWCLSPTACGGCEAASLFARNPAFAASSTIGFLDLPR
jgi:hypothetical protein